MIQLDHWHCSKALVDDIGRVLEETERGIYNKNISAILIQLQIWNLRQFLVLLLASRQKLI